MKIAIFGGSFDPPHIGHEEIIKEAIKNLDIDTLFVVPTFLNPFKQNFFATPRIRLQWIRNLIKEYPKAKILDYEIKQDESTPTIKTIKYLQRKINIDKIYLIIGADNIKYLYLWQNFEELEKLVTFVVAKRNGIEIPKHLKKLDICANISSTELRESIKKEHLPKSIADDVLKYYKTEKNEQKN